MWKVKRSGSKQKKGKHIEEYALEFADKPMYLERVSEDISGESEPQSAHQNLDTQNQSLASKLS
jgi:hypothetical protein